MSSKVIPIHEHTRAAPSILGSGQVRVPIGGKIRAGIQVLTPEAAQSDDAVRIYNEGVARGASYEAINDALRAALPSVLRHLQPSNIDHFVVRPSDFDHPLMAEQIMRKYAEDRGDGVARLYRFPVVFASDTWQDVMPHEMVVWNGREKLYWSEYDQGGKTRYCMTRAENPPTPVVGLAHRRFGPRQSVPRRENHGVCDPENCVEYQLRECKLQGRFIFMIPGIKALKAFQLATNSFYAMQAAIEQFQLIQRLRGGRLSGYLNRDTPLYITKKQVEISRTNAEGETVTSLQWIVSLDADVDLAALVQAEQDPVVAIMRGAQAAAALEYGSITLPAKALPLPAPLAAEQATPQQVEAPAATGAKKTVAKPVRAKAKRRAATQLPLDLDGSNTAAPDRKRASPRKASTSVPTNVATGTEVEAVVAPELGAQTFDATSLRLATHEDSNVLWLGNATVSRPHTRMTRVAGSIVSVAPDGQGRCIPMR